MLHDGEGRYGNGRRTKGKVKVEEESLSRGEEEERKRGKDEWKKSWED